MLLYSSPCDHFQVTVSQTSQTSQNQYLKLLGKVLLEIQLSLVSIG